MLSLLGGSACCPVCSNPVHKYQKLLKTLSTRYSASGSWLPGAVLWMSLGEEQGCGWCCWGLADGLVAAAGRAVLAACAAELPSHSPLPDCSAVS